MKQAMLFLFSLVFLITFPASAQEVSQKAYIVGQFGTSISRLNLDGSNPEILIPSVKTPSDMLVKNGRLYWSDLDSSEILSVNLDGSDPVFEVVKGNGVHNPYCFDFIGDSFYWCERLGIEYGNFNSATSSDVTIDGVLDFFPTAGRISEKYNRLYWGDQNNDLLHYVELATSSSNVLSTDVGGEGLALDEVNERIYITAPETIWVLDLLDGANKSALFTNTGSDFSSIAVDPSSNYLFVIDKSDRRIHRLNTDGTGFTPITPAYPDLRSLAVDSDSKQLFFGDAGFSELYRTDYNGFGTSTLIPRIISDATVETEIYEPSNSLFLSQRVPSQILKVNLTSGTSETFLGSEAEGARRIQIFGNRFYWVDPEGAKLRSSNLDGTDVQDHVGTISPTLEGFYGIFSFTVSDNYFYWVDGVPGNPPFGSELTLYRSLRDGTGVQELPMDGINLGYTARMRVDESRNYLFVYGVDPGGTVPVICRVSLITGKAQYFLTGGGVGNPRQFQLEDRQAKMYYLDQGPDREGLNVLSYDGATPSVSSDPSGDVISPIGGATLTLATDKCPLDPVKTEPGVCGCGFDDLIVDGIFLCGVDTAQQKYERLIQLLKSLRGKATKYDAQAPVRAEAQALFSALQVDLALNASANTLKGLKRRSKATKRLEKFLRKRKPKFKNRKRKAIKSIRKLELYTS